jgi:hypothetical protein
MMGLLLPGAKFMSKPSSLSHYSLEEFVRYLLLLLLHILDSSSTVGVHVFILRAAQTPPIPFVRTSQT